MGFLVISKFLLILTVPFILFLIVLNFIGFDNVFYQQKFREYKVQQNVPQAALMHEKVIDFVKGKDDELPGQFNEREIQHLWDVRNAIRISTILLYIFIILFAILLIASALILKVNNKIVNFVGKALIFGGFLTVILAAALFFFVNYNFSQTFESFHSFLFKKDTYTFDPAKEIIVRLYPEELFMDLGLRISKWVVLISFIIILFGIFFIFKSKKQKNKNRHK